jgi:aspartyl protease family protein
MEALQMRYQNAEGLPRCGSCRRLLIGMVVLLASSSMALAAPAVRVLALFPGKAMLEIDGQRKILAAGDAGRGGVRLISADPQKAIVEIDGRSQELRLGSTVSSVYKQPSLREVRIVKSADGSYYVDGLVNGQPVRFLVDTGATSVAMSERHADRLGINHRVDGLRVRVGTASGSTGGYRIELSSLSIAGLRVGKATAVVIDGDSPRHVLLGMSVLGRFEIDQRDNLLVLRSRY